MSTSIDAGDGGEESDDSSSFPKDPEKELDDFRNRWKSEIKNVGEPSNKSNNNNDIVQNLSELTLDPNDEEKATSLFLQGAELERNGKVFEAMRLYKRSIKLVPDIEKRIYERNKHQKRENKSKIEDNRNNNTEEEEERKINDEEEEEEDLTNVDLLLRFHLSLQKFGYICQREGSGKVLITTGAHFCDLPPEIILYVFRWVVSNELDVQSLNKCSEVCKGFYVFARDPEIWRAICLKVWGVNVGILDDSPYLSWRQMFYERNRVLFSGAYISKTSYIRYGENSFQDQFYRPLHLIEYYRFLRFFSNGTLIMYTSSDKPTEKIDSNDTAILRGHYRLRNDAVVIVLKPMQNALPQRRRGKVVETSNRTFHIELLIKNHGKRRFCKLEWVHYSLIEKRGLKDVKTDFDLTPQLYPPFGFSRAKSYHLEASAALV